MKDDELYRKYLAGDSAAGDALMLRYADALTAYLSAFLHSAEDAEDLMLDCFTVILVDRPKIREGSFRAYLYRTARNMANRLWKKRYRREQFSLDDSLAETLAAEGELPEDSILRSERSEVLYRCLNRIAPQYREALWLVYGTGMSYADTAKVLGCGIKKVENMLYNGKKQMRAEMEKEGITDADR